jgi:hypothetical protein
MGVFSCAFDITMRPNVQRLIELNFKCHVTFFRLIKFKISIWVCNNIFLHCEQMALNWWQLPILLPWSCKAGLQVVNVRYRLVWVVSVCWRPLLQSSQREDEFVVARYAVPSLSYSPNMLIGYQRSLPRFPIPPPFL